MKSSIKLLVVGLAFSALSPQLRAQVTFAPVTNYFSGRQPLSVVAADVNGDGKVDLTSVNTDANALMVLTNNGSGGFGSNATYTTGATLSVVAADVNEDDKVDLICGNRSLTGGPSTIVVLTNDGSGRFGLSASLSGGTRFYSVTTADVNGDGKLDVIGANAVSPAGTVLVFTNNGSGDFALSANYAVGNNPFSVVAADLNEDDWVDLICANYAGNNLSVLTNNGSGGFVLASSPNVGNLPISVVAADVNGDGMMDLVSANSGGGVSGNSLSVLTNVGSGSFVLAPTYAVGTNPCVVMATDVSGDGKTDLISANFVDNTFSVLTNNGSGGFTVAVTCFAGANVNPRGATAADVNGDGRADLISANFSGGNLSVLINIPALAINCPGSTVVASWSSSWTNWVLQQNTNLSTTNWTTSSGISDNGTNKSLTVTQPTGSLFFRLSYP